MRIALLLCIGLALLTAPLSAQVWGDGSPSTPRFEACLPEQMQAFESALQGPTYGMSWQRGAMNVHWVQHCGYLAMGICEVSDNSLICQRRLRTGLEARGADMRALLPNPDAVEGTLAPLYAQAWALALGRGAGDDCVGWDYRRGLWCQSFQAALKLEQAVMAWQVARLMGVMGPLDWTALSRLEDE